MPAAYDEGAEGPLWEELGELLAGYREHAGITAIDAAAELAVEPWQYRELERGFGERHSELVTRLAGVYLSSDERATVVGSTFTELSAVLAYFRREITEMAGLTGAPEPMGLPHQDQATLTQLLTLEVEAGEGIHTGFEEERLAQRTRAVRFVLGLSQPDLAGRLRLSRFRVRSIEAGEEYDKPDPLRRFALLENAVIERIGREKYAELLREDLVRDPRARVHYLPDLYMTSRPHLGRWLTEIKRSILAKEHRPCAHLTAFIGHDSAVPQWRYPAAPRGDRAVHSGAWHRYEL